MPPVPTLSQAQQAHEIDTDRYISDDDSDEMPALANSDGTIYHPSPEIIELRERQQSSVPIHRIKIVVVITNTQELDDNNYILRVTYYNHLNDGDVINDEQCLSMCSSIVNNLEDAFRNAPNSKLVIAFSPFPNCDSKHEDGHLSFIHKSLWNIFRKQLEAA